MQAATKPPGAVEKFAGEKITGITPFKEYALVSAGKFTIKFMPDGTIEVMRAAPPPKPAQLDFKGLADTRLGTANVGSSPLGQSRAGTDRAKFDDRCNLIEVGSSAWPTHYAGCNPQTGTFRTVGSRRGELQPKNAESIAREMKELKDQLQALCNDPRIVRFHAEAATKPIFE